VVRVYYTSSAILDKDNTKFVRYTVGGFLQNNERMLKIIDATMVSPHTPDRGMININQTVYHELNMTSKVSGPASNIAIPNSKEAPILTKDGQTMPMNALLKRRQMQVSHLYKHMRNLHVISQDPVMAGEQVVQEVASAILTQQHLYAQLTVPEISRLLTDGLASLDYELWLPNQAIANPLEDFNRAYANLNPTWGMPAQPISRGILRPNYIDVEATLRNVFTHYVNLLRLTPEIMEALGKTITRLQPILQEFREEGLTMDNILWIMRQTLSQIERVISLIRVATPDTPLMQYPGSNNAVSSTMATLTAPLQTMAEVATAISILPNFSGNHKLRDELDNRQRGIITIGNGYQPPKADKAMVSTETAAVKKKAAAKLGRGTKPDTGSTTNGKAGKRPITSVNYDSKSEATSKESKSDSTSNSRSVMLKKPTLTKLTEDIEQQAFCSYFLSSKGCNRGDECPYSHNMPADPQEARLAKQSLDVFNLTWSADFRDNYVIHFPPATSTMTKSTNPKSAIKVTKKTG
jgi:hypothetical protein